MRSAIGEANQVAAAEGQAVETPVEKALTVVHAASQNRSSMLRDLENGSQTEIDALNGEIVERAGSHGIDVPVNRTLTLAIELASSAGRTE